MPFATSAVLMATICPVDLPCKNFEVARFSMGQGGVVMCETLEVRMNAARDDSRGTSVYFCLPPEASNAARTVFRL